MISRSHSRSAISDWAREKGLDVNDRGRIPGDIGAQYEAETSK